MDSTYAEIGVQVILWRNHPYLWGLGRSLYLGTRTTITTLSANHEQCLVSCDNGLYIWAVSEMILASDIALLTPEQRALLR